jgi:hypothetical protein
MMRDDNFVFCIYGFLRDMKPHRVNMNDVDKFVYVPKRRYEDTDIEVTSTELKHRFGENTCITAYEYDARFFNEEVKKLNVPHFNNYYQQPQRILSFFKHIRDSLLMLKEDDRFDDETIIFLFRSDMGIKEYDLPKSKKLLQENDIIIEKFTGNGLRDFWFVLKKKNISVFTSLYESYKTYLVNAENKQQPHPKRGTPESTLFFHFNLNNKKVIDCPVMKVDWRHVCNKYCGHHKGKTEILGES